jgi:4-oxalomesaconate tautomerase
MAEVAEGDQKMISVEHPSGEFSVELETGTPENGIPQIKRAALLRTTRRLMEGNALVPATVWDGTTGLLAEAAE